ncbi:hypothetical protein BSKO_12349 [Bryopsis sp. KO-2023]|nr:hypothetical protein BSKO_12349 [Bryopsis sp. KO-2023]
MVGLHKHTQASIFKGRQHWCSEQVGVMWHGGFIPHLVVLLAWSHIVCSQEDFPASVEPEPQCDTLCCGDPVTIPSEQNFQLLIIPFETADQAVFPTSITKEQALGNLSEDFLQPETIEEIATFTSNYFQVDASSLDPFSSSRCDIPLSSACLVQRCGCNARRRNLLQCFPILACSFSGVGADEGQIDIDFGDAEPAGPLPPALIFGICLMDTCTLFQIEPTDAEFFNIALTSTCPDILPVPAPATVTEPITSTGDRIPSPTDVPSPPPPVTAVSNQTTPTTVSSPPPAKHSSHPRIRIGRRGRRRYYVGCNLPGWVQFGYG